MQVEDGVSLFGLRHKDYARTRKIAAARILARIGLEEGKRYLRRNYVRTPFKRVHPEEEDGPKRDMAASTSELYRLVRKETNDGRDIIIRRAADRPDLDSAKLEVEELVGEFNQFALERDPDFDPVSVPADILARSLTQRMDGSNIHVFDPADYYDLDRDEFYFCQCQDCDECDEYDFFIEFMRELEEETDYLFEDP